MPRLVLNASKRKHHHSKASSRLGINFPHLIALHFKNAQRVDLKLSKITLAPNLGVN